jgi:NAD(P)-dependent dehydrogenase (short-subunit alcohol dehydrogenase family)
VRGVSRRASGPHRSRLRAIVNLASVSSFQPDPSVVDYSVAKAALASLMKGLSMEFGPRASGSTPSRRGRCGPEAS